MYKNLTASSGTPQHNNRAFMWHTNTTENRKIMTTKLIRGRTQLKLYNILIPTLGSEMSTLSCYTSQYWNKEADKH